ncbi:lipase 3-like [Haematobia irritans]|uniref:lipase 3-like n=1 Tax=Haematobia irritans TaxID=7368 RepID=UPI003F4F7F04
MKILIFILIIFAIEVERKVLGFLITSTTTADRIENFGYTSETHILTTKDGYILTLFRIKNSTSSNHNATSGTSKPVVLMVHGLTGSSDCWIIRGAADSLAFNLVDNGYDVWLGNCRGNPYSSRHVSMSTNERKFWHFSWDIMADIDLPTFIDYILKQTGESRLHYVGHSQGTAIMFSLLSTRPEYNRKIKTTHMMAPIAFMSYAQSQAIRLAAPLLGTYSELDPLYGDRPFLQNPLLQKILGISKCRSAFAYPGLCSFWLAIAGGYTTHTPQSLYPEIFKTHPGSCSAHQFVHLVQLHVSGHFRRYDYGIKENMILYNRTTPPDYKLTNINLKFPLNLYYSDYDVLSSKRDVEHLSTILGNQSVRHFIDLPNFGHFDFMWAAKVKEIMNHGILQRMHKAEDVFRSS